MRKPFIAGNWKMNNTIAESTALVALLKKGVTDVDGVEIMIAPPSRP